MIRFIKRLYRRLCKLRNKNQDINPVMGERPFSPPRLQKCSCCSSAGYMRFAYTSSSYLHGRINTIIGAINVEPPPANVDGVYITRV